MKLTRTTTVAVSLALILLSVVLQWLASREKNALLESLAATTLSLGAVSLIAEFFLRSAYTHDLLSLVGLRESLHTVGVEEIVPSEARDWVRLYQGSSEITTLILRTQPWLERDWSLVLNAARARSVQVTVFMPDPTGGVADSVAQQLGIDSTNYAASVREVAGQIESSWKAARESGSLNKDSTILVEYLSLPPAYGLIQSDGLGVISLSPPVAGAAGTAPLTIGFDLKRGRMAKDWFEARWRDTRSRASGAPIYTDRKPQRR